MWKNIMPHLLNKTSPKLWRTPDSWPSDPGEWFQEPSINKDSINRKAITQQLLAHGTWYLNFTTKNQQQSTENIKLIFITSPAHKTSPHKLLKTTINKLIIYYAGTSLLLTPMHHYQTPPHISSTNTLSTWFRVRISLPRYAPTQLFLHKATTIKRRNQSVIHRLLVIHMQIFKINKYCNFTSPFEML